MTEPYVRQARGVINDALVGSADVKAGDAVYFDGTDWEFADADAASKKAEMFVINNAKSGEKTGLCKSCILVDIDANAYTQGSLVYLTGTATAGNTTTQTRPTAAPPAIKQVLGYGLSANELSLEAKDPWEHDVKMHHAGATSAFAQLDTGDYGGPTLDAQNEVSLFNCMIPENAISLAIAYGYVAAEATGGTPTMDITVSSAIDGEQWDAVVADATLVNQVREGAAADEMQRTDYTTGFNATDIWRPGALLGVRCLQDDAGTDISFTFSIDLVCRLV